MCLPARAWSYAEHEDMKFPVSATLPVPAPGAPVTLVKFTLHRVSREDLDKTNIVRHERHYCHPGLQ